MKKIALIASVLLAVGLTSVASAAKLSFEPSQGTVTAGCPMDISVMLDTEGSDTTAMDLRVQANLLNMDFNNFVGEGGIFRAYTAPRISDNGNNATMYVLASTLSRQGINKSGKVGTITVTPKKGATSMPISFVMVPNTDTDDSNVAVISGSTAVDALNSVVNANFNVVEGSCDKAPAAVLSPEKTQAVTVQTNTQYVPQYGWAEKMDGIGAFMAVNIKAILLVLAVLIVLIVVLVMMRKHQSTPAVKQKK